MGLFYGKNSFILLFIFSCGLIYNEALQLDAQPFELNSITVEGNERISNSAVTNYSKLQAGDFVSDQELNEAYNNLVKTKLFRSVKFKRRDNSLIIEVEEYPTVNIVSFEGNRKFTDQRLSKLLTIKPRFVFSPKSLENDIKAIEETYRNSGRISARIQTKVINLSDNRVNVIFEIYEGNTVEVEKISFVGNRAFSDRRLRRVLESKQAGILRKLILRDTLISDRISLDKRLLKDFYRSRGYADFDIFDVNVELSEEKDAFFVSYNVKEGPQFRIEKLKLVRHLRS